MIALSLLVAACTSDPADDVAGVEPPQSAEPATTGKATGAGGENASDAPDDAADDPDGTADGPDGAADGPDAMADSPGGEADDHNGTATDSEDAAADPDDPASGDDGGGDDRAARKGESSAQDAAGEGSEAGGERSSEATAAAQGAVGGRPVGTGGAAALRQSSDCEAVADYVRQHAEQAAGQWGVGGQGEMFEDAAMAADDAGFAEPASAQPGIDYSTSNIQEAGIDEPDVLKTDGRRMVVASENKVHVVDVTGSAPTLIASVPLDDLWISDLLLHGDRVLVFASQWGVIVPFADPADGTGPLEPAHYDGPTTQIVEIDLSGATPTISRRLDIEGGYVGARMIDGVVRVATTSHPRPAWAFSDDVAREQTDEAEAEATAAAIDAWLPRYALSHASGSRLSGGHLVSCERIWVPPHYAGGGTLSITTIDIADEGLAGPMDTTSIMSDASTLYASRDHLYVSTSRWHDWRLEPAGDADSVESVETEVHLFDIAGRTASTYVGSAAVTGTVLNQYSMSEHEGHLRIATTTTPAWWTWRSDGGPASESLVTVFAVGDDGLSEVGRVDGLGVTERIYAVRYLGDVAAVVTFREVDPLYLLDLSDPTAPTVRGELKIPGYSSYLHPLGDGLLLGVGQEATDEGFTTGSQVSLFDISDLNQPRRIAQWTAPGARSQVEFNPLAFLHWQPSDLVVLPLNQYPQDENATTAPFLGAVALRTADEQLTESARFSHADPAQRKCREEREVVVQPDGTETAGPWNRYCWFETDWAAQVIASAVVGDRLYLASNKALESVSLGSLERASLLSWKR